MELRKTVLLVEDDADHAELIAMALNKSNAVGRIDRVEDGSAALQYLWARKAGTGDPEVPGLILLDLRLPGLSGIEVLRTLKSDPALRAIPVVVLTTSDRQEEIRACYELGANSFVTKPVEFSQFQRYVGEIGTYWGMVNANADPDEDEEA